MRSSRWIAGMMLLAACGGSSPQTPAGPATAPGAGAEQAAKPDRDPPVVHKRGKDKLIVEVGPKGGTLELDNGARLLIPEGALAEGVDVTLAEGARTTAFSNHDYERPIGPSLEVGLGATIERPIQLSIPLGTLPEGFGEQDVGIGVEVAAAAQRGFEGQATVTRWEYLDATSENGRAVAKLDQAPQFRVQFLVSKND